MLVSIGALSLVTVLSVAGFAAAGAAAPQPLASVLGATPLAAHGTPKPPFSVLKLPVASLVVVTQFLQAGNQGEIAIRVTKQATCGLTLRGPKKMHAGPYVAVVQQTYGLWRWTVPHDVRGGTWVGTVVCRSGGTKKTLATKLSAAFTASNRSPIVAHNSMTVSVTASAPAPLGSHATTAGKGGGGYPNDDAICKWTGQHGGPCTNYDWGYRNANGTWNLMSGRGFYFRNCTDFVAWFEGITWSSFGFPSGVGNAADWKAYAAHAGFQVTQTPSVGDIAWWGSPAPWGHVAVVTAPNNDGTGRVSVAEYNGDGQGNYDIRPNIRAEAYLHKPSAAPPQPPLFNPAAYNGHIVKQNNGSVTSWLVVDAQGHRNWIPTGAIYNCLAAAGHPVDTLTAAQLDQLPDQNGIWANCTPPPTTAPAPAPTTPAPTTPTTTTSPGSDTTPPTAPGGLHATSTTTTEIYFAWSASMDNVAVTGYRTYLNGSQNFATTATTTGFGGLACGTTYTIGVAAYDAAGNYSAQSSVSASTAACPAPPTWSETVGGNANTWTNWTNAGGSQGPTIPAFTTVQIACRLTGFTVQDGNNWWYRIASSPWNGNYYVSADAFYNNGATSGSLHGTPFVDTNVATC